MPHKQDQDRGSLIKRGHNKDFRTCAGLPAHIANVVGQKGQRITDFT